MAHIVTSKGKRQNSGAGYLLNDDSASGGRKNEADVLTCSHCQAIINYQAWRDEGGFCHACFAPVCDSCAVRMKVHGCELFMKKVDEALEAAYRRDQLTKRR